MRYFENSGTIRKAISVLKQRTGNPESTIREFGMDRKGLRIGEPLKEFEGVLTGAPRYPGDIARLLQRGGV